MLLMWAVTVGVFFLARVWLPWYWAAAAALLFHLAWMRFNDWSSVEGAVRVNLRAYRIALSRGLDTAKAVEYMVKTRCAAGGGGGGRPEDILALVRKLKGETEVHDTLYALMGYEIPEAMEHEAVRERVMLAIQRGTGRPAVGMPKLPGM